MALKFVVLLAVLVVAHAEFDAVVWTNERTIQRPFTLRDLAPTTERPLVLFKLADFSLKSFNQYANVYRATTDTAVDERQITVGG